ncbi:MAG: hypothetical protein GFH27_549431n17 [Chloroflexi bacterium AL-W]|nr:hypothetical protein [Chloroflexi bacterium AL-N5]NOK86396.1 hypothetical protein [Chloroflexi bacterium AL-W]
MQSLELWYYLDDHHGIAITLEKRGVLATAQTNWETDHRSLQASLGLYTGQHDQIGQASALLNTGTLANKQGQISSGRDYYKQSLALAQHLKHQPSIANSIRNLRVTAQYERNDDRAYTLFTQALHLFRVHQDDYWCTIIGLKLSMVSLYQQKSCQAIHYLYACSVSVQRFGNTNLLIQYLACWAALGSLYDHHTPTIQLWGATQALCRCFNIPVGLPTKHFLTKFRDSIRDNYNPAIWETAWIEGQTLAEGGNIDALFELTDIVKEQTENLYFHSD